MDKTVKNKYAVGLNVAVRIKDGASIFSGKEDDWQACCGTLGNENDTVLLHIDEKCDDFLSFA